MIVTNSASRWYASMRKISPPCPICGGLQFDRLANTDRYGMGLITAGCQQCGLVQTHPRPSPKAMASFYESHYRAFYQTVQRPSDEYVAKHHKRERLAATAAHLARSTGLQPFDRILDVGCSEGTLFEQLQQQVQSLELFGIEPNPAFASFAVARTGATVVSSLSELRDRHFDKRFDLIVVNHVLEHVDNPVDFLRELSGMLSEAGALYVDVPDVERYQHVTDLHIAHLFHFSIDSLIKAMCKSGLVVRTIERHEPPHHPASIRALAAVPDHAHFGVAADTTGPWKGWHAVRAIQKRAWRYHARKTLVRVSGLARMKRAALAVTSR